VGYFGAFQWARHIKKVETELEEGKRWLRRTQVEVERHLLWMGTRVAFSDVE
jgi:hypothetical protein